MSAAARIQRACLAHRKGGARVLAIRDNPDQLK